MSAPTILPGSRPDLSIVIINWNTLQMLREVLQSVFDNAGGLILQVIVVDNASEDESPDMVAAEFPQTHLIRNTENRGFAAANNQGFEVATGRQILLLNSDTIVLGDVLAASVAWLDTHPRAGAMGCRVLNTDRTVQLTCSMFPGPLNMALMASGLWKLSWPRFLGRYLMTDWQRNSAREVEVISGCYLIVRREVIDQVGPLDEDFFFFGEETDWCYRMRNAGWEVWFAPVGEIIHHGGGSVKKLSHKRDVILTDALIRLNAKHGGWQAKATMWMVLFCFNLSRAVFWSLRAGLGRAPAHVERARHFRAVAADLIGRG